LIAGTDVGDVTIGNYAAAKGLLWDKSLATFYVKGSIVAGAGSTISADYLTSGTLVSKQVTLSFTDNAGDCFINCGKTDFTNTDAGFIMGIDDSDSNKVKFMIGNATEYLNIIGDTIYNTLHVGGYSAGDAQLIASDAEKSDATVDITDSYETNFNGKKWYL